VARRSQRSSRTCSRLHEGNSMRVLTTRRQILVAVPRSRQC
jgi:hypothetical protein